MPIYEYQCKKCEETLEVLQKADEEPLQKCGKCGGSLSKLVTSSTFHLYGPGFHTTDNKRKYLK